ncbi:MAG: hypothetical protein ACK4UN_12230 [Limisphaerales bacterium]
MKKTLLIAVAALGLGIVSSKADVAFSVSFGRPACAPVYRPVYPAPVVVAPAPVVVTPAPVYVAPTPVYHYQPVYAPVYPQPVYTPVYPQPVVVQPAPVVVHPAPVYRHAPPVHSGFPGPGFCNTRPRGSVFIGW